MSSMSSMSSRLSSRAIHLATQINVTIGRVVSWLTLGMVMVVFAVVVLRYGFSLGWVWLQETYVWMHGLIFMLAMGFTLARDEHVRVDILYRGASWRRRAWIDLGGCVIFLLPFAATVCVLSWPYAATSWSRLEVSPEAGGLPGLFLLKSIIPFSCILLFLQGIVEAMRAILILTGQNPDQDKTPPLSPGQKSPAFLP